jgi:hypothetical protein
MRPGEAPERECALYRLLALPGLSASALRRVLMAWAEEPELTAEFWDRPLEELRGRWGLPERAIRRLQICGAPEAETAREMACRAREADIELLSLMEPGYRSLAATRGLPPLLFTRGNQDLLWAASLAFLQSRDASERGLAWGSEVASALARRGVALVSSQNREGYRQVAAAAKRYEAPLVIVLDRPLHSLPVEGPRAEPVSNARLWDDRFRPERELLVSVIRPGEGWQARHARERDTLVARIARGVVAGDVRPEGIMAEQCRKAAAQGRKLFLSPLCRVELDAERLSDDPETAAAVLSEAAGQLTRNEQASPPAPGRWLAAGWDREVREFVDGLRRAADAAQWIELEPMNADGAGESEQRKRWLRDGLRALIAVPPHAPSAEGLLIGVGDRRTGEGRDRLPVVVLAPQGEIHAPADLRGYLRQCRERVAALLTGPPSGAGPAPDRSLTPDGSPSP